MLVSSVAFAALFAAATYLVLLGVGALVRPERTKRFLESFASSLRVHVIELAVRVVIGAALVVSAPRLPRSAVFAVLGWVLVGTTLVLALIPWRYHHRFARWSVPQATRHMPLLGVASVLAGLGLLSALLPSRDAG